MAIKFLDTSSLLLQIPIDFFYICDITLIELEGIKNSANKDQDIKQKARTVSRFIMENYNKNKFKVINYDINQLHYVIDIDDESTKANNDLKILASAFWLRNFHPEEEFIFYTNDINLYNLASNKGLRPQQVEPIVEDYSGIFEVTLSDEEMAEYYSRPGTNFFNLYIGEYLIIRNKDDEVVDISCWNGSKMRPAAFDDFASDYFGRVKPKKGDPYQTCLFDSLTNNKVTLINGRAGSGKTFIALSYLFSLLDRKVDRIVIFCNPVIVKNAAKIGFVPGDVNEKLLTTQMGNILFSKLGDKGTVEDLIDNGKIVLIPVGDSRGYEVPPNSAVIITEGQNYNIELLRLLLQRCAEDSIIVVEGDALEQVDLDTYSGENSGMRSMSKVFRGDTSFGQVELKNIQRSHTAQLADKMR